MTALAVLIDFGSTYTKVAAVDLDEARILGRAQSPSTVGSDVAEGLGAALGLLGRTVPALGEGAACIDSLADYHVRATSSAAGGLSIAVIGLVPGLTVEAANAAALGAGAKVVGAFCFKLTAPDMAALTALAPDMILLTGGTDGGDTATIVHNAEAIASSSLAVPVVVAGNALVRTRVETTLAAAGKMVIATDNVMPVAGQLRPVPAQDEIRKLFMQRITDAKGLDRIKLRIPIVLPTPMAVQKAAELGAGGLAGQGGCGELLVVDVGGATTDVYSVGEGKPREKDIIPASLPEPYSKRTVEGDLGIRYNAKTILERAGADFLYDRFAIEFREFDVGKQAFLEYVRSVSAQTQRLPHAPWQFAADAVLAQTAVDAAIARHVGRSDPYYASGGAVFLVSGKDLTECPMVIGTGGIFAASPHAAWVLSASGASDGHVLRPKSPKILIDHDYALYVIGLLADSHPGVALEIFRDRFPANGHGGKRSDHLHRGVAPGNEQYCC